MQHLPNLLKQLFSFLFFLAVSTKIISQNLVKNPSFEAYKNCPQQLGTFNKDVLFWTTPSKGSSDYFNVCSAFMSAPKNFKGVQKPFKGKAYAGLYAYAPNNYREYVQGQLKYTLKNNLKYTITFYISLAEGSDLAINQLHLVLSKYPLQIKTKAQLTKGHLYSSKNQVNIITLGQVSYLEQTGNWVKMQANFTAKGFEKYLVLGNLKDNKATNFKQLKRKASNKGAYYYLDQVDLKRDLPVIKANAFTQDSVYTFKNIHFNFNTYTLTKEAVQELEPILEYLASQPKIKLQINGHTDYLGKPGYNKNLSLARAKAVANYFVQQGIAQNRIKVKGYGAKQPLILAKDSAARRLNRRVEFILLAK